MADALGIAPAFASLGNASPANITPIIARGTIFGARGMNMLNNIKTAVAIAALLIAEACRMAWSYVTEDFWVSRE